MADLMNSNVNALYVAQSGALDGRPRLLPRPGERLDPQAYKKYLSTLFTLCGYDAEAAAQAAVDGL